MTLASRAPFTVEPCMQSEDRRHLPRNQRDSRVDDSRRCDLTPTALHHGGMHICASMNVLSKWAQSPSSMSEVITTDLGDVLYSYSTLLYAVSRLCLWSLAPIGGDSPTQAGGAGLALRVQQLECGDQQSCAALLL
ncbi:hypothetical protein PG997_010560 [Apiospora hydei]|uniref:Uncharacterized protein n=1 Tax=Apiospora hydei TaxID=1337664 RepID=A0ABR1VHK4_9PEZI